MREKRAERRAERMARKELLRSETAAQRIERMERERAEKLRSKSKSANRHIISNWKGATHDCRSGNRSLRTVSIAARRGARPGSAAAGRGDFAGSDHVGADGGGDAGRHRHGGDELGHDLGLPRHSLRTGGIMETVDADLSKVRVLPVPISRACCSPTFCCRRDLPKAVWNGSR